MKLIPTDYKIEFDSNEYIVYYIVLRSSNIGNKKWFIAMYDRNTYLNVEKSSWTNWVFDEYGFDTPEKALEKFETYLKTKG